MCLDGKECSVLPVWQRGLESNLVSNTYYPTKNTFDYYSLLYSLLCKVSFFA